MAARSDPGRPWSGALVAGLVCTGVGLLLFLTNAGHGLVHLGYDLLFRLKIAQARVPPEILIVYMDDISFRDLDQTTMERWNLNLHADLVERMTAESARVVVFDVIFNPSSSSSPANDPARFAQAIRRNGKVVLAAGHELQARPGFWAKNRIWPRDELLEGATVGIAEVYDPGDIARQYYRGNALEPSLPWAAAKVAGLEIAKPADAKPPDTWLNYYGEALTLRHVSYVEVTNQPAGFFRDKYVFVGAQPKTLLSMAEADTVRTPYSALWGGGLFPGVEIGATAFGNLLQHEGLSFWDDQKQLLLLLVFGVLCGGVFSFLRPWWAGGAAVAAGAAMLVGAGIAYSHHLWFAWTVPVFAQLPVAVAWSIGSRYVRLKFAKEVLEQTLQEATRLVEATKATAAQKPAFLIPDHSLVRLVGRGAYGEVWLARNTIGTYHVVKLVKRRGFPSDEPYEREFRGIQKFMPISRSHPGFVHLLHVGRNDEEKFFYCIMEAGDDRVSGQRIDPETYQPRTLASEMDQRGLIPPEESLRLGLALCAALDCLHRAQLIHRDIKPPNIIYVNGAPKFADIGLVTDVAGAHGQVSQVGTEGYLAPEGPGTPGADVYALGKVLYEAAMGRDRRLFPEMPTAVFEQVEESLLRRLTAIIFHACEPDPQQRYQSAALMRADLERLAEQFGQEPSAS